MGRTGAGKTTYIDSFINYLLGVDFYDKFRYKLVDERDLIRKRTSLINEANRIKDKAKAAQVHSMTSTVSIYHIPSSAIVNSLSYDSSCVNLIDTPGFGDTRGHAWDEIISKMITELLNSIE